MKPRLTLSTKVFLIAVVNFLLLGVMFVAFVMLTFGGDLASFLFSPARERIMDVSRRFAAEIETTPNAELNSLTERYSKQYGIGFYVFLNSGRQVAGREVALPPPVQRQLSPAGPPGGPRGGPPRGERGGERGGGPPRGGPRGGPPPPIVVPPGPNAQGPPLPTQLPFFVLARAPMPYWIGVRIPVRTLDDPAIAPGTLFLVSETLLGNPFVSDLGRWLTMLAAVAVVSLALWVPFVRRLTRTIDQMMKATVKIAEGDFNANVNAKGSDELGLLGSSINRMASRLETFVKGQKRFLGDVAHELRSPLGRMQIGTAILERQIDEHLVRHVAGLKEEIDLMSDITTQLLTFAKAELRPDNVALAPMEIAPVVARAVHVEAAGKTDVRVDVSPDLRALAESEYLFRCLSNLIRNSMRYAGDAGPIEVTAEAQNGHVFITVADSGPGVPEEALEKIFEPFYRVDSARDRRSGGTGLGLAIVRSCVEACQGSVECRNRKPSGLAVTLRFAQA